jgi:Uma2 family endonuclease
LKRPDLAVLSGMPDETDADEALRMIPVAVVEVLSKDYEYKDLVLSPPLYLENGVMDILILDPPTKVVLHYRPSQQEPQELMSPVRLELQCGCEITV